MSFINKILSSDSLNTLSEWSIRIIQRKIIRKGGEILNTEIISYVVSSLQEIFTS